MGRSYAFRVVWAFVLAPIAAAVAAGLMVVAFGGSLTSAVNAAAFGLIAFGYPVTFALGLPLYLLVRRRIAFRPAGAALAGAVLAATPLGLFFLLVRPEPIPGLDVPSGPALPALAYIAALGALGGWVFWLVAGHEVPDAPAAAA